MEKTSLDKSQMQHAKGKKSVSGGYILYDFMYMTFWERQNYRDRVPISGCQGLWLRKKPHCKGSPMKDSLRFWNWSIS